MKSIEGRVLKGSSPRKFNGGVRGFVDRHFHHFNAGALRDCAQSLDGFLNERWTIDGYAGRGDEYCRNWQALWLH